MGTQTAAGGINRWLQGAKRSRSGAPHFSADKKCIVQLNMVLHRHRYSAVISVTVGLTTAPKHIQSFLPQPQYFPPPLHHLESHQSSEFSSTNSHSSDAAEVPHLGLEATDDASGEPLTNQVPLSKIAESCLTPLSVPPVKVHVIAHRGASGNYPDHTLESYRAAFLEGADWIEIDVQCTADGHLVVNHDVDLALWCSYECRLM